MAELQSLLVNDSASNNFPTASNTTDVGYIWFNDSSSKIEYSGWSGDSIIAKELGNSIPSTSGSVPALYEFTSNTFNNSSATGATGPTLSNCQTEYSGQAFLNGFFSVTSGVQFWTVPQDGDYSFTIQGATGGQGGSDLTYGKPAQCTGTFTLSSGDIVRIVVGQSGTNGAGTCGGSGGGGGGATAVSYGTTEANSTSNIIAIAGGGGAGAVNVDAGDAQTTQGSLPSQGSSSSTTPSLGNGGASAPTACVTSGNGGGGWNTAGNDVQTNGGGEALSASLPQGGDVNYKDGGFGGGGSGGQYAGGGGGGYTGGSGGGLTTCSCGSINGGTGGGSTSNLSGGSITILSSASTNSHGSVAITKL